MNHRTKVDVRGPTFDVRLRGELACRIFEGGSGLRFLPFGRIFHYTTHALPRVAGQPDQQQGNNEI